MGEPRVSFTTFTLPWAEIPLPLQGATGSKPPIFVGVDVSRRHGFKTSVALHCGHISRYASECRTSSYGTITQFKCKNNYEHLLIKKTGAKVAKKMSGGIERLKVNGFADRNSGRISMKRTENANLSFIFEEENTILEKKNEQILLQSVRLQ